MITRAVVLKSPGFAGLGDLILALDRALQLALATDRTLVVDWRDTPYSRGESNLADQLFELHGVHHLPPMVLARATGDVLPVAWQGHLDQPLRHVYASLRADNWNRAWASAKLDAGLAALDSDAAWVVVWDHSSKALQAAALRRLGSPEAPPLSNHILPHSALQDAISTFRHQHFRKPIIGVHLRASSEAMRAGKSADLHQVFQCLDQLQASHAWSDLFLASDNAAAIEAMRARYPDVLTRPKWLPAIDTPLHLAEGAEPSGLGIARDALIELALLASCDWLLHPALSSFSLASARLADLQPHQLFPIQSPSLYPGAGSKAFRPSVNIINSLKNVYRRIRYAHSCPVCGGSFDAFTPIDPKYQSDLTQAGSEILLDEFETLNTSQYSCPLCGTADRNRLAALALAKLRASSALNSSCSISLHRACSLPTSRKHTAVVTERQTLT